MSATAQPRRSASAAPRPAASPMTKQPPLTRAADCAAESIDAQRPATSRLCTRCGSSMRQGSWLKPREPSAGQLH